MMEIPEASFESWYLSEHPHLVSALTVVSGNREWAVDATDEAFARAWERWVRVSVMEYPSGWAYRTGLNLIRRRARRTRLENAMLRKAITTVQAPPPDWSPELWDVLRGLPYRERTAVALRYVGDLSINDVASAMGIAQGTVSATLHSARQHLAANLDPYTEDPVIGIRNEY